MLQPEPAILFLFGLVDTNRERVKDFRAKAANPKNRLMSMADWGEIEHAALSEMLVEEGEKYLTCYENAPEAFAEIVRADLNATRNRLAANCKQRGLKDLDRMREAELIGMLEGVASRLGKEPKA